MAMTKYKPTRTLTLTSGGFMKGRDVTHLQGWLAASHPHLHSLKADGEFGPATASAVAWWKRFIAGMPRRALRSGWVNTLSPSSQLMVMGAKRIPRYWLWRGRWRRRQVAQRRRAQGLGVRAYAWAHERVGLTEQPAGSNHVPTLEAAARAAGVQPWIAQMGYPWCALFFHLAYLQAGGKTAAAGLKDYRFNALYTPTLLAMAQAGEMGMRVVGWSEIRRGDGLLINFPGGDPRVDHIAMAAAAADASTIRTVEGNTSFGDGDQANGGAVASRVRGRGLIAAAFRVTNT